MRAVAAAAMALALSGCATFSKDGGLDAVSSLTAERTGQDVRLPKTNANGAAIQDELNQLLKQPLTADSAVRIALIKIGRAHV